MPEPLNSMCHEFRIIFNHSHLFTFVQYSRLGARRCESTEAESPHAGGHLPSITSSKILHTAREATLRIIDIKWLDENGSSPLEKTIGGRGTRKMNIYQAVRDAMRYICLGWLVVTMT